MQDNNGVAINPVLDVGRGVLSQQDLCFPLQMSRREVRNAVRREAIPTIRCGRSRKSDAGELIQWMAEEGMLLGIQFVRAYCRHGLRVPRPERMDERPPSLESRLDLLRPIQLDLASSGFSNVSAIRYPETFDNGGILVPTQCCRRGGTSDMSGLVRNSGRFSAPGAWSGHDRIIEPR
jgi:hypothetical protein